MSDEEKGAVHVYVDDETHDAFADYLRQVGLEAKTVLIDLLVTRELRLRRLLDSSQRLEPAPTGSRKISGYLGCYRRKELEAHALPLSAREAVSRLISIELQERWLMRALEWTGA